MISAIVNIRVKEEYLEDYKEIVFLLTRKFRSLKGCISYTFNQNKNDPLHFILFEQWEKESDLENHLDNLATIIGPSAPNERFPARLVKMYSEAKVTFLDPIESDPVKERRSLRLANLE